MTTQVKNIWKLFKNDIIIKGLSQSLSNRVRYYHKIRFLEYLFVCLYQLSTESRNKTFALKLFSFCLIHKNIKWENNEIYLLKNNS